MPFTDLQPVIIQELAPPFRTLTLGARSKPKPIRVTGRQRAIQTWYPGSTKASVQVLGTQEEPIILEGRWDDPFGTINPAQGAGVRVGLARGLMQGQNLCQLLWGSVIIRQGRVVEVSELIQKKERREYRIVFEVDQANEPIALAPAPILNIDSAALVTALAAGAVLGSLAVTVVAAGSSIGGQA